MIYQKFYAKRRKKMNDLQVVVSQEVGKIDFNFEETIKDNQSS